jgi:hypothetical protein
MRVRIDFFECKKYTEIIVFTSHFKEVGNLSFISF